MAITNGLDVRLYVEGNDLSGDANALDGMGYTQTLLDTTTLDVSAMSRMTGLVDGSITINGYFDTASDKIHDTFTSNSGKMPTADQIALIPFGGSAGSSCIGILAKEADYSVNRSSGSAMTVSSTFTGTGTAGDFGEMLTAHDDTHASAGSGTVVNSGASSASGGVGYCQIMSLASGTVTVKIQHCSTSGGTYTDLISFTATGTSDVPVAYRSTASGTINQYLKVTTTGTFSNAKIAVALSRS